MNSLAWLIYKTFDRNKILFYLFFVIQLVIYYFKTFSNPSLNLKLTKFTVKNIFYNLYFFFQQHVLAVDKVNNLYLTYNLNCFKKLTFLLFNTTKPTKPTSSSFLWRTSKWRRPAGRTRCLSASPVLASASSS